MPSPARVARYRLVLHILERCGVIIKTLTRHDPLDLEDLAKIDDALHVLDVRTRNLLTRAVRDYNKLTLTEIRERCQGDDDTRARKRRAS